MSSHMLPSSPVTLQGGAVVPTLILISAAPLKSFAPVHGFAAAKRGTTEVTISSTPLVSIAKAPLAPVAVETAVLLEFVVKSCWAEEEGKPPPDAHPTQYHLNAVES